MKQIADNNFYSIAVDEGKNRMYLAVKGFWKDAGQVSEYLNDFKKALKFVSKGYSVVSDLTDMKTPSQEIGSLHVEAQQLLVNAGLKKTAEIHPASTITQISLKRFSEESGMKKGLFRTKEEAEQWLDA
ncbi:MAG: hypothetical protein JW932_08125 [Deltaproteobacteria bacterium]|nr:hypothetical protein [Deltaproteobacteria bacterium]